MPMNTVEIANNIEKVRIRKIKAFARLINIEDVESKGRMELIEEIKNHPEYKRLTADMDGLLKRDKYNKEKEKDKGKGYVYVMVSSEKPNLVKIGMTKREPEKRAKELSQSTGVSMPYIVAYKSKVENPSEVERIVHESLSNKRVNPNREFFRVETNKAIRAIEEVT